MTIDISKIKPGDEVTVLVSVQKVHDDRSGLYGHPIYGGAPDRTTTLHLHSSSIVSHTPKELQPGDRVKSRFDGAEYEIVAGPRQRKDGAIEVALWSDELGFFDSYLSNLERV